MKLSSMQDIGGCRAVFWTQAEVEYKNGAGPDVVHEWLGRESDAFAYIDAGGSRDEAYGPGYAGLHKAGWEQVLKSSAAHPPPASCRHFEFGLLPEGFGAEVAGLVNAEIAADRPVEVSFWPRTSGRGR